MDPSRLSALVALFVIVLVSMLALMLLLSRCYRKVEQGTALIISTRAGSRVTFTGALVMPILHSAEVIHLGVQTLQVSLRGAQAPSCKDGVRVSLDATLFVQVNRTKEDILKVAQTVGCKLATDGPTLERLFRDRLVATIETVFGSITLEDVLHHRERVRDEIVRVYIADLNGYVVDDLALSRVELVPVEAMDPQNPCDALGIVKLTQIAAEKNVQANEVRNAERLAIMRQNQDAEAQIRALQARQEEAEAKVTGGRS